jgi:diazepam-binding inhibitor (GABA receptor modulator, acyl-CoA-binding protein)
MSDVKARFDAAVAAAMLLDKRPNDATLLKIYGLYKQASFGDVTGEPPAMFDIVNKSKYNAWDAVSGMTRDEAMKRYADLIDSLKQT